MQESASAENEPTKVSSFNPTQASWFHIDTQPSEAACLHFFNTFTLAKNFAPTSTTKQIHVLESQTHLAPFRLNFRVELH